METFAPGTLEYDLEVFRTFNTGEARTLKLIAQHSPVADVMFSVCDLIDESMYGAHAIALRIMPDGSLHFVSNAPVADELHSLITERVLAEAQYTLLGQQPERFEFTDPSQPETHEVWGRVIAGIDGQALGALCVTRDWPDGWPERTKGAFYSALRLLQIGIEQHRAAHNYAQTIAAERQRVANELHDDPIQEITVLSLMLQRIGRALPDEQRPQIDEARRRADIAIERMRHMLFELHPASLDQDGLAVAIEVYLEEKVEPLGIEWSVDDQLDAEPEPASAVLLFSLIHEALANVASHSAAHTVAVRLANEHDGIGVRISDDGRGFDPASIAPHRPGHLGLSNVRYLARRTGGRFEISSAPGAGCTVDIWVPLDHGHSTYSRAERPPPS